MDSSPRLPLAQYLSLQQRLQLHLIVFIAVIFLSIYGKLVCPFIDGLELLKLLFGLGLITVAHIGIREYLYGYLPLPWKRLSLARNGFYLSMLSWLLAGVVAMLIHVGLYPDFPWASHIKLMTGYWALGAGLLSQLEYAFFERHLRQAEVFDARQATEHLVRRLLESFTTFTLVPALAITLLVFRLKYENLVDIGVAFEILFLSLFFVTAALIVGWYWGHTLRKDTNNILHGLEKIGAGKFDTQLDASRPDELGQVALSINDMAAGLTQRERIREAFGRFVSPEVADRFIQDHVQDGKVMQMGGERRELAVLMCDLRDFTPLSESLPPEQLTELLNAYFSEMVQAIRVHRGMVDKFIGDAIMVVFGMVESEEDCALSAVKAAQAMRERLAIFNQTQAAAGKPTVRNGIGIHVGELIAGYIGSVDRMEFTVIGHTVNLAARIEAQTKAPHPPVLFSHAVAERVKAELAIKSVCCTHLKGVEHEVELFTVDDNGKAEGS